FLKKRRADDPYTVSHELEYYIHSVVRDLRSEGFYYRFSWHVIGYDGEFYTVVLRLKMYYYDFVNYRVIYEFSDVVETVKVSVYDRRVIYDGVDVGIWPFWLMPWERYEGAKVKLAEITPFFELNGVTNPFNAFNITFDAIVEIRNLPAAIAEYFREVLGIVPERVVMAATVIVDPLYGRGIRVFVGEDARKVGEPWLEAYVRMAKRYYPQLRISITAEWEKGMWMLHAPEALYDTVTGAALEVSGINDVSLMVMPSPLISHFRTYQLW
ncbi:MAG: hypothetical protein ACK4H7_05295, partial [Acidilobaceae archaeon]